MVVLAIHTGKIYIISVLSDLCANSKFDSNLTRKKQNSGPLKNILRSMVTLLHIHMLIQEYIANKH